MTAQTLNLVLCGLGLALYGMLLGMTLRAAERDAERDARSLSLVGAGTAGVTWHLTTLLLFDAPVAIPPAAEPWVLAVGLVALGFLPAFAIESAATATAAVSPRLRALAYGASAATGAVQLAAAAAGAAVPQGWALLALVGAHVAVVAVLLAGRRGTETGPVARVAVLALFALSALHFVNHGTEEAGTFTVGDIAAHHAAIPLAVALLLQDFPFAFADLFLKRAARLLVLTAGALALSAVLLPAAGARGAAALVVAAVLAATLGPTAGRALDRLVDRVWLARGDLPEARRRMAQAFAAAEDEAAVLAAAAAGVREALALDRVTTAPADLSEPGAPVSVPEAGHRGGSVVLATLDDPHWMLALPPTRGGRRLLSDDVALLEWVSREGGRRLDALRREAERREAAGREESMRRLATEAELRALRAQLNPHFLFNALTTLGWLMDSTPSRAKETLYRLTSLLRAVLGRTAAGHDDTGTLGEEIALLEDYLAIEQARFEERLRVEIDVPEALDTALLPPLLLQPLVENAIKHGISPMREGGTVRVEAREGRSADGSPELAVVVSDTGAGFQALERPGGVGLGNVRQRIAALGGRLLVSSTPQRGSEVRIALPLRRRRPSIGAAGGAP